MLNVEFLFFLGAQKTLNVPEDFREGAAQSQGAKRRLPLSTLLACLHLSSATIPSQSVAGSSSPDSGLSDTVQLL